MASLWPKQLDVMVGWTAVMLSRRCVILVHRERERPCQFLPPGPFASLVSRNICLLIALRGPQYGLPHSVLKSALVTCKLAAGVYSTCPGRKIWQPGALTPEQQTGGWLSCCAQRLLVSFCPSHLGPPGLLRQCLAEGSLQS